MPLSDWPVLLLAPPPCQMPLSDWSFFSIPGHLPSVRTAAGGVGKVSHRLAESQRGEIGGKAKTSSSTAAKAPHAGGC